MSKYFEDDEIEIENNSLKSVSINNPRAIRDTHFTMKVNKYELDVLEHLSLVSGGVSKAAIIRMAINEVAKQKGVF